MKVTRKQSLRLAVFNQKDGVAYDKSGQYEIITKEIQLPVFCSVPEEHFIKIL